jgi:hypothetical protein
VRQGHLNSRCLSLQSVKVLQLAFIGEDKTLIKFPQAAGKKTGNLKDLKTCLLSGRLVGRP